MIEDTSRSARLAQLNALKASKSRDAAPGSKITSGPDRNDLSYKAWLVQMERRKRREQILEEIRQLKLYGRDTAMPGLVEFSELRSIVTKIKREAENAALADPTRQARLDALDRMKYQEATRPRSSQTPSRTRGFER